MNIPLFSSLSDIDQAGVNLICSLGIPPMDAFLLLKDLLNASRGRGNRIARARKCIRLGEEALVNREKSVPFSHAIAASLEAKSHRRPRTLQEIRYIATRMMKKCPELARKQVRSITPEDCEHYLLQSFSTVRQRYKGRLILSGILNFSLKRGWCRKNAASLVPPPPLKETRIRALSLYEAKQLLHTAKRMFSGECLPACALMLYAGIRPYEVRRLTWNRINLKSGLVSLAPNHTKTGGSRHVSILPVLAAILNQAGSMHNSGKLVCPPNWEKKWRDIRRQSGILRKKGWVQDVLRHTYASYHLAHFGNCSLLQKEMGHATPSLLLTRYLNMDGITPITGAMFLTHGLNPPSLLLQD